MDRTETVAARVGAMPAPAGSLAARPEAAETVVSRQAVMDSSVPSEVWVTPPAKLSPIEVPILAAAPVQPLVSPPDSPPAESPILPTVAVSAIEPPAAPALVPLPPRRPGTLALRRMAPASRKVVSVAAVAAEPVRADANVWSPPREAGRYRLPWGVAQLGERDSDDTARGPQWTFAVEP